MLRSQEFLEVHTLGGKSFQSQDHTSFQPTFAPIPHQAPATNTTVSTHARQDTWRIKCELLGQWLGSKAVNDMHRKSICSREVMRCLLLICKLSVQDIKNTDSSLETHI